MDLEQREKSHPITGASGSATEVGALPKKGPENVVEDAESKRMQRGRNGLNGKKRPDLPRRASKRLAGIDVDPIPELKNNNRARRVSAKQLDVAEASTARNLGESSAAEGCAEKTDTMGNADEKQGCPVVLPLGNPSMPEEHGLQVENDNKTDKPGSPLNVSLNDLWTDPCIEFAIKTLTGAIPIGDENKGDDNPSSLELPFGDSWGDPCIEFAVKTLTGAIPVVDDLGIQDYLQQQLTSSEDKGSNLSDVLLQHFDAAEKPSYGQQEALLTSMSSSHDGNSSLGNLGDAALHPRCEERRSEESRRQTIRQ